MSNGTAPPTLTYAQVASIIGKSVSTVERWVQTHNIPFHRVGRNIRFDRTEIARWLEENELLGDNRIQPVTPGRRGGAQYVYPSQTLGDEYHCWCGEEVNHDWEGKDRGAPHPHDHEGIQQVVVVEQRAERQIPEWQRIDRGALRGYHAALKAFLLKCVNDNGLPWRAQQNSIQLFPPDETQPATVYCRNNDQQMRQLTTWYSAHVQPYVERVDNAAVARLAETVNDPVEHPASPPEPEHEWHPYMHTDGEVSEFFETDGTTIRCSLCVGKSTAYETPESEVRGLGGHVRMVHRDSDNMRTPEALAKALDSKRYNRLHAQVKTAVELLAETIGFTGTPDQAREIDRLTHALEKETQRANDLEARLRLMNEAFRGLE